MGRRTRPVENSEISPFAFQNRRSPFEEPVAPPPAPVIRSSAVLERIRAQKVPLYGVDAFREDSSAIQELEDQIIQRLSVKEPWSECSTDLDELLQQIARPYGNKSGAVSQSKGAVVWTLANKGFSGFVLNLVKSWDRIGLRNYFVVAVEPAAAEWLEQQHIPCYIRPAHMQRKGHDEFQNFLSGNYLQYMRAKPVYTLQILRAGYDQIYADADMAWLRDPMDFVEAHPLTPTTDYWVQNDTYMPCGGFYWLRSNHDMEEFFMRQLENLDAHPGQNEQYGQWDVIQEYEARNETLRWRYLPMELFPNGRVYFQWRLPQIAGLTPFIVHSNWVIGRLNKIWRMRENNLWFIDPPEYFGLSSSNRSTSTTFLSIADTPVTSLNEYRSALVAALSVAAILGRTFVVPLIPCSLSVAQVSGKDWCDITSFAVSEGPVRFNIEKQFAAVEHFVPLRSSNVLSDPRFLQATASCSLGVEINVPTDPLPVALAANYTQVIPGPLTPAAVPNAFKHLSSCSHIRIRTLLNRYLIGQGENPHSAGSLSDSELADALATFAIIFPQEKDE